MAVELTTRADALIWAKLNETEFGPRMRANISDKIRHLMKSEGKPQTQAVAIALSMARSGRLKKGGRYVPVARHQRYAD